MDLKLKNKKVVVTGSTRGIGYGIARRYLEEGSVVCITGRDPENTKKAEVALLKEFGKGSVISFCGDLTNVRDIERCAIFLKDSWTTIDIIVPNLGSGQSVSGIEVDFDEWEKMLSLNLISPIQFIRATLSMLPRGSDANIVFIGSIAGKESLGAPLAYGAAKAGLTHTMKELSRQLASDQIRVNMIMPGNIYFKDGTWDKKLAANPGMVNEMLKSKVPLMRFGTVDEIADAVCFLSSYRSSFTTGACLVIDGGQTSES